MKSFKQFIKGGQFVKLTEIGDSIILRLACDPFELKPEVSPYKSDSQVFIYKFEDPSTGEEKTFRNGNMRFAQEISKYSEGDLVKIILIEGKNGKGTYAVRPTKGKKSQDLDDDDEDDLDDEDETPKKKKKAKEVDWEDDEEDDEDEKPVKKKKKVQDDEDEDDEEEEEEKPKKKAKKVIDEDDEDDEEDETPKKKKKKKVKKSDDDDDDIDL